MLNDKNMNLLFLTSGDQQTEEIVSVIREECEDEKCNFDKRSNLIVFNDDEQKQEKSNKIRIHL